MHPIEELLALELTTFDRIKLIRQQLKIIEYQLQHMNKNSPFYYIQKQTALANYDLFKYFLEKETKYLN